ncbi:hypothetical protein [Mangrovicoccus ximenensis]|uniref:hypothetical protein n=1 Tax=Mangrovicoccus ximenensis TaxID=1911570 RepID=UPI000D33B9AA|nr:hypothetical protein [Mangrovicoccus ximenensis]
MTEQEPTYAMPGEAFPEFCDRLWTMAHNTRSRVVGRHNDMTVTIEIDQPDVCTADGYPFEMMGRELE